MESIDRSDKSGLLNLSSRHKFAMVTMIGVLIITLYTLYQVFYKMSILTAAEAGDLTNAEDFDDQFSLVSILMMVVGIANVVAVCMFVYAIALNTFKYYSGAVSYVPGMAVGWFFIPVANIFMVSKTIRDISRASNAMVEGKTSDQIDHTKAHGSAVMFGTVWVLYMILFYVSMAYGLSFVNELKGADPNEVQIFIFQKTYYIQIVSSCLSFLSGVFFLMFMSKITKEQNAFREN